MGHILEKKRKKSGLNGGSKLIPWYLQGSVKPANLIAVYQPMGAASLAASYNRLAGSGGNASLDPAIVGGTAPGWNSTDGWIGGSSAYLKTGITTSVGTAWTVIVRYKSINANASVFGCATTGKRWNATPYLSSVDFRGYLGALTTTLSGLGFNTGVMGIAGTNVYKDGISIGTLNPNTATADELFILSSNNAGSPTATMTTGSIQAIAFYNTILTPTQISKITAGVQALNPT